MAVLDTRLLLGTDPDTEETLYLDIAKDPGLVIIAPVGAGKSYLAKSLTRQALAKGWEVVIYDPKRMAYREFFSALAHEPWLCDWMLTNAYEQFMDMVKGYLWPEFTRRMDYIEGLNDFDIDEWRGAGGLLPRLIIIDELQAFFTVLAGRMELNAQGKPVNVGKDMVKECQTQLASMLALFRASGMVPVLIAQTGNTDTLPSNVKNNASAKIQLGNTITDAQWLSLFGDSIPSGMPRFVGGVGKGVCQLAGEVKKVDVR